VRIHPNLAIVRCKICKEFKCLWLNHIRRS
jgi:hypothetical protein